jgi:hypothetical protein
MVLVRITVWCVVEDVLWHTAKLVGCAFRLPLGHRALRDSAEKENIESGHVGLQYSAAVFEQEWANPVYFKYVIKYGIFVMGNSSNAGPSGRAV